jgi:hypothetical protein
MRLPVPAKVRFLACVLLPVLAFVVVYRWVWVSHPDAAEADLADEELFTEEERVGQITDAFRLYAQAFDNRFPEVERIYGDELMRAVRDKLQIPSGAGRSPLAGFGLLTRLQRTDPTFGYHGSGARLGDERRVLVHWSSAAGKCHVLFCDLSHREVDHRELSSLLCPWQTLANQCVVRVGSGGSGTVVSPRGLVVTADHVLPPRASGVAVRFADGRVIASTVIGRSKRFDVAVLEVPTDRPVPFVRLAERPVGRDEPAWVIGYGGGRSEPYIREVRTVQYVLDDELITTWNKVGGGDSGGAVLDARGRLIGVLLAPADPHPKTCRTTASPTLLALFPVLARQAAPRKAELRR